MKLFKFLRSVTVIVLIAVLCVCGYNVVLKHLYPKKFSEYVEKYSAEYGVPAELVYAVIKCESNFEPEAKSSAGAVGLMQLTEATFTDVGKMLQEQVDFKTAIDPETNIRYGTRYLKYLSELFEGDAVAVVAAYNAGLRNVSDWMGDNTLQTEEIAFAETRNYVEKVNKAQKYYQDLYKRGE